MPTSRTWCGTSIRRRRSSTCWNPPHAVCDTGCPLTDTGDTRAFVRLPCRVLERLPGWQAGVLYRPDDAIASFGSARSRWHRHVQSIGLTIPHKMKGWLASGRWRSGEGRHNAPRPHQALLFLARRCVANPCPQQLSHQTGRHAAFALPVHDHPKVAATVGRLSPR